MRTLLHFFLFQRPFRLIPTPGVHLMLVGNSLSLAAATANQFRLGWPTIGPSGGVWVLALAALGLLALVVLALVREYVGRPDKPRHFWQLPGLLRPWGKEAGRGVN